jgi:N-[(2S)-2-amino-2-carboxyethyl]-L-glutamate dehydrogenase
MRKEGGILLLTGRDVTELLDGREEEVMRGVGRAYEAHARGQTALPHSTFLRFPGAPRERIIALPAYLGDSFAVAGVKWIASFPGNVERGMERASAVIILNSTETGRPEAVIEGSVISARRTAASAALAARHIHTNAGETVFGLVGAGVINFEITRFLRAAFPGLKTCFVFDLDASRAAQFADRCRVAFGNLTVEVAAGVDELRARCPLVSLATTASRPHIDDISACPDGATILHVSLRDLSPSVILSCDNILDDIEHVCREQTSLHLTEQEVGRRDFMRCTLGDILCGRAAARDSSRRVAVFSPFGLGILDLAVAEVVRALAEESGAGAFIESFLPAAASADGGA